MIFALIYAILSPLFFGLVYTYDKYVVEKRAKNVFSYTVIDGSMIFLAGLIIALFLDWSSVTFDDIVLPIILGILLGLSTWFYYYLLQKEDVSNVIGILYVYPVLIAILSFFFLNEKLSWIGYAGMILTITGTILLSTRLENIKRQIIFSLVIMILLVGTSEFLIKVSIANISPINGAIVESIVVGIIMMAGFFIGSIRNNIVGELKNIPIAAFGSVFFYGATITLFLAMNELPATIVATISVSQPLFVLFFEKITNSFVGKISKDMALLPKLGAISLIVLGIILIYLAEL